jgi:negative regulator of sigma E activity
MIRDVMKSEPVAADLDLAARICAAIDDEPSYTNITPFHAASGARPSLAATPDTVHSAQQVGDLSTKPVDVREPGNDSVDTNVTSIEERKSVAKTNSTLKTGLTGFALAASVALVTVVGMNIWQTQGTDQTSLIASTQQALINSAGATQQILNDRAGVFAQQGEGTSLPVVEFVSNTGSYWVSPETTERVSGEQRLNMMLSQHIENSPTSDREGLLPYSRLVGYDERGAE